MNELYYLESEPKEIATRLTVSNENLYRRQIQSVNWLDPKRTPFLFHTAAQELNIVKPLYCTSCDYVLDGMKVLVSYVLPFPHANRVKNTSEIVGPHKAEALASGQVPYTYLKVDKYGQIRMNSTILDNFLLVVRNTGLTYSVNIIEINDKGEFPLTEIISLADLPVIDADQFNNPNAIMPAMGGLEFHSSLDIASPVDAGYIKLRDYLEKLKGGCYKSAIIDFANEIVSKATQPDPSMMLTRFLMENIKAHRRPDQQEMRLIVALIPDDKFNPRQEIIARYGIDCLDLIHEYTVNREDARVISIIEKLRREYSHKPQMLAFLDLRLDEEYWRLNNEGILLVKRAYSGREPEEKRALLRRTTMLMRKQREIVYRIAKKYRIGIGSFMNPRDVGE